MTQEERIKLKRDLFFDINICLEKISRAEEAKRITPIANITEIQKVIDIYNKIKKSLEIEFENL